MTSGIKNEFEKNLNLEAVSAQVNAHIETYSFASSGSNQLQWQPIFIVGAPRSGTTLLLQYLASTRAFAYPTNLMSRFYSSLPFACQVQLMLADGRFDFGGEFSDVDDTIKFESSLGKTKGIAQPSEFWYFWRRFFPLEVPARLNATQLASVDRDRLVAELCAMEEIFERPILMKGVLMCFHIDYLQSILKNAIFIHIKRDTIGNARSLLSARKSYFGSISDWYSALPPGHERLKLRSPYEQVVGQVLATNREIEHQLLALPKDQRIEVDYENFCNAPQGLLKDILRRYTDSGITLSLPDTEPSRFESRDHKGRNAWQEELERALAILGSGDNGQITG